MLSWPLQLLPAGSPNDCHACMVPVLAMPERWFELHTIRADAPAGTLAHHLACSGLVLRGAPSGSTNSWCMAGWAAALHCVPFVVVYHWASDYLSSRVLWIAIVMSSINLNWRTLYLGYSSMLVLHKTLPYRIQYSSLKCVDCLMCMPSLDCDIQLVLCDDIQIDL